MANLKLYPHGITAGIPGKPRRDIDHVRGECKGWSRNSVRSLLRLLYSLDLQASATGGHAFSFTFTLKRAPATPDHWKRLREAFFRSIHRLGVSKVVWLTEWQRRGVPHLHGIVILPSGVLPHFFVAAWLRAAKDYEANLYGQDCKPIYDTVGWCEYLGKHSARGVDHYQRNSANIPKGWQGKTGRLWGRRGDWVIRDPIPLRMSRQCFFSLRRVLKRKAISEARSAKRWTSLSFCRRSLKCGDAVFSQLRGVSQFIEHSEALAIIENLQSSGYYLEFSTIVQAKS